MSDTKITRDELLILLRDTYVSLNDLLHTLREPFLDNMDEIVDALTRKRSAAQNNAQTSNSPTQ